MKLHFAVIDALDQYLDNVKSNPGTGVQSHPKHQIDEDSAKFYAGIMLCDISKKIVVPTCEEWIGLNLLERDDELRRMC